MTKCILDGDTGSLRKAHDEELPRIQAAAIAGVHYKPVAPLDRTRQEWLVGFQGLHEPPRIPQALIRIGRDPAGAADFQTRGEVQHFLFRARAAVQQNPGAPLKDNVMVFYKFKNEQKAGLGMPMPAGNVRVYQKDSKGNVLFVGEDRIDHTPKDELVTIHIGNAFDVVSERKQTDYKRIDTHTWEMEFEITLRNHKDTPVTVEVNEPIGGDWEMLSSTYKYTKTAAWAAQFQVPVSANGTSVLKYRVRAKW